MTACGNTDILFYLTIITFSLRTISVVRHTIRIFKLNVNILNLFVQTFSYSQQPVANGHLPEQKIQQFKVLMAQKLQGMRNERDVFRKLLFFLLL